MTSSQAVGGRILKSPCAARRGLPAKKMAAAKKPAAANKTAAAGAEAPAAAVFFAAADLCAGAPRRPVRARAPTLRGGLLWDENHPSTRMISS